MLLTGTTTRQKIYRLRPSTIEDYYGETTETWDPPQREQLHKATAQAPTVVEEGSIARRVVVEGERRLYVPGRADLTSADRVEIDGEVWRVNGDPVVRSGLGSAVYTTAKLDQVETS